MTTKKEKIPHNSKNRILVGLMVLAVSSPLYAFDELDDMFELDEFVVTSTKSPKTVYRAPSVASVISSEQIERSSATDLAELLEQVAGIHVYPSPFNRMTSLFSVRGMQTRMNPELLFLVNGEKFKFLWTSALPHLMRIPLHAIDRVEVIKGPGSALYGADAYSGVINIITKTGKSLDGPEFGMRLGSFQSSNTWLQFGFDVDDASVGVFAEQMKSNGDSSRIIESDALGAAPFAQTPGAVSSRYNEQELRVDVEADNWKVHWWHYDIIDAGVGVGADQVLDENGYSSHRSDHVSFNYENTDFSDNWALELSGYYHRLKAYTHFVIYPPGFPFGPVTLEDGLIGNPANTERQYEFSTHFVRRSWQNHVTRLGFGYHIMDWHPMEEKNFPPGTAPGELTDVTGTDAVFSRDFVRTIKYALIQDEWLLAPDWELTWGFRYDDFSDFGGTFNPRAALVWSASLESTVKFLYGSAFREPAVDELTARNNPVQEGNADLDPQTIDTFELAYSYRSLSNQIFQMSGFYYRARDMIDFFPQTGSSVLVAQGEMDRNGYGFELEGSLPLSENVTARANFAWQRSVVLENEDIGVTMETEVWGTPQRQAYVQFQWQPTEKYSAMLETHWVSERLRAEGDTRDNVPDYFLSNLSMQLKTADGKIGYEFSIKNMFDNTIIEPSDGQIPADYPMPSRSIWFGINADF